MRLEPVLLVAQDAPPATMPTRRAFLFAGTMLAVGATLGGACGYAIGSQRREVAAPPPDDDFEKSGDADLDELRRLAVKAPIEELVKHRLLFVNATFADYPRDKVLWRGVRRLTDHLLSGGQMEDRRVFAMALAGVIERADLDLVRDLRPLLPELRRVR